MDCKLSVASFTGKWPLTRLISNNPSYFRIEGVSFGESLRLCCALLCTIHPLDYFLLGCDGQMGGMVDSTDSSHSEHLTHTKPWLTPGEQVEHLRSKGVKFELISSSEAEAYLTKNSNYFRLRAYRTGFPKVREGKRKGEYSNLDFKMLIDLSIIDMLLRYELLPITLDIEHFSKVRLLNAIEAHGEDGYEVVADYIHSYDRASPSGETINSVKEEIRRAANSPYLSGLVDRYPDYAFPAWSFVEVVTFGTFVYFYKFCADRFDDSTMRDYFYLLQSVKTLRNACAHNNCILNDLVSGTPMHKARYSVTRALGLVPGVSVAMRKSKMNNDRMQEITTALYVHHTVASDGVRAHRGESLMAFKTRMNRHLDYYQGNCQVLSSFDFLSKVIDAWYIYA